MMTYTFGLQYPDGDLEEIDVEADNIVEARRKAETIAESDYLPGWTLVELPDGATFGNFIAGVSL